MCSEINPSHISPFNRRLNFFDPASGYHTSMLITLVPTQLIYSITWCLTHASKHLGEINLPIAKLYLEPNAMGCRVKPIMHPLQFISQTQVWEAFECFTSYTQLSIIFHQAWVSYLFLHYNIIIFLVHFNISLESFHLQIFKVVNSN